MASTAKIYDVLIIGAGPAGLSTALGVARQTYSALVFDSQKYRNAYADHMHNVVTWDHRPPAEFRAAARENIQSRYNSVHFQNSIIDSVAKKQDGTFEVKDDNQNKYQGKKLVLATGVLDVFPDIKGFGDLWGNSILDFTVYSVMASRSGVPLLLASLHWVFATQPAMILHLARMASPLAEQVTVYCNGDEEITTQVQKEFEGKPLTVDPRKITALERNGEHVKLYFEDGHSKEEAFLVCQPPTKINGSFHEQLGLVVEPMGYIKTTPPFNETSLAGAFAVGDCGTIMRAVPQAIAMGSFAAGGLVAQLGAMGKP